MKITFNVKGRNWEMSVVVDDDVFSDLDGYFEAVTKAFDNLYRVSRHEDCNLVSLMDENGSPINLPQGFDLETWKRIGEQEGYPAPEWDTYVFVKTVQDEDYTAVPVVDILRNAGLVGWLNEVEGQTITQV